MGDFHNSATNHTKLIRRKKTYFDVDMTNSDAQVNSKILQIKPNMQRVLDSTSLSKMVED